MSIALEAHSKSDLKRTLDRLAIAHRILAMEGHNDMTLGHMSAARSGWRGVWLKKSQRGLDEVFGSDDFVLIDFRGKSA